MGLPRYLENTFRNFWENSSRAELAAIGLRFGSAIFQANIHRKINLAAKKCAFSSEKAVEMAYKWGWRRLHIRRSTSIDELTRERALMYVGLQHETDEGDPYDRGAFLEVQIPRYFRPRLEKWNKERQDRDRAEVKLRQQIAEVRGRVYSSRVFPTTLRTIIFARDNYTCQVCLRHRATLLAAGLHLECDHIDAWIDGGQTTYKNGVTICSDCNKAKHHAKAYLGIVGRLGRAAR
ncbi:HNH endonuclease [Massilia sp. CCM 9210]|uniref:HNH endonuclease n=1 Tax=Massilia scottii TaxID=3057166 RepID=UPI00279675A4|nr:HNH endonuclease [Massilia sp. CCM 9210]MDQ1817248.1 HNH endonuclease [Massilia sp. CCM 9210]